jgi:hypothetical protein
MKDEAIRQGIKEQTQILRALKADKKKGHKVDYLIDQTEGQLIALQRQVPRGQLSTFLPFLLLNGSLGAFLFSGHFAPFVEKVLGEGLAKGWLTALIETEHYVFFSAGALAVLVAGLFLLQWKLRRKHAAVGNVAAFLLEFATVVVLTAPWNWVQNLFPR